MDVRSLPRRSGYLNRVEVEIKANFENRSKAWRLALFCGYAFWPAPNLSWPLGGGWHAPILTWL